MKINLLPESETTKVLDKNEIIRRSIFGLLFTLATIAIFFISFGINMRFKRLEFVTLESKYKNYVSLKTEVQTLKEGIHALNKEFGLIDSSLFKKFFWSEKLLSISKIMPKEIWLREIRLDKKDQVKVQGLLLPSSSEERPISVLSQFIRSLKEDKAFSKDFSEIALVDVKSIFVKDKDIYEFNIALTVKK